MKMKYLVLHHTAVHSTTSQLNGVNNYHKDKWNMKSTLGWYVGYNYFIDISGKATNTRDVGEETMAQVGHNFDSISVCLAGNFNEEVPSEAQNRSLRALIKIIKELHPEIILKLHRDVQYNRTCPGKLLTLEYLRSVTMKEPFQPDTHDKKKKEAIIAELAKSITLLQKLVAQLQRLLWRRLQD